MTLDDFLKLLSGGASTMIPFALYLLYKAIRAIESAGDDLKAIREGVTGLRSENKDGFKDMAGEIERAGEVTQSSLRLVSASLNHISGKVNK